MDLRGNLISDVSALSNLTNLAELHLDNNPPLSDISPLSKLTNLTQLGLSFNSVSDISALSNLTNLTELYLDRLVYNPPLDTDQDLISDISALSNLTNLSRLSLAEHSISDISALSNLTNLTFLYLGHNAITDVSPLAGLTSLKWLYLLDNPVANPGELLMLKEQGTTLIDIYVPSAVTIPDTALATAVRGALDLATDAPIPPDALASLKTLEAPSLGITQLTGLEAATGLTQLILNDNQIQDVSSLAELTRLETLNLRDNEITDVSPLADLTSLKTLDITNNPIENVGVLFRLKQARTRIIGGTVPNTVVFRDDGLEAAVREALSLADTDPISPDVVATLTTLDASRRGISDLRGIEYAMRLETLNLRNNEIEDVLPLAELTGLTRLVLDGNSVENGDVLFRLKQRGTRITGVTVPDSVFFADAGLEAAVRSASRVSSNLPITAEKMRTLTRLTATRKGITDLTGLEEATGLTTLDLGDNAIVSLGPLQSLASLTSIDLADNQIANFSPLTGLNNVETLDLSENVIVNLPSGLTGLSSLETLDLADNQIQDVSPLQSVSSLTRLELQNNEIEDVTPLSTMTHLKNLYLRGNDGLTNLKELVKLKEAGTSVDITLPKPVTFRDDSLAATLRTALDALPTLNSQPGDPIFPEDMELLTTFTASNQSIVTLTGLETATNLTNLNLSGNTISSLTPLAKLVNLETLNLADNEKISSISSLAKLTVLTSLNLSNNKISSVSSLSKLVALETLNLSGNNISSLTSLSDLMSLTDLNLANNKIKDVLALQDLTSLTTLNLLGNGDLTMEKASVLYTLRQGSPPTVITLPDGIELPNLANIVEFNNANLAAAVRSALRITKGYPVLKDKIKADLTRLTATRKEIDNLTGIEEATGLTTLDLGDNAIVELTPLENLTSLTSLDLADNAIVNLTSLQNLSNLTSLDLDDNQIADVSDLSGLSSLQTLDLRDNSVTDVEPLMDLTNLRYIYLKGNEGITNLAWLGALENLRVDIKVPDVVGIPDTDLDTAVRAALRTAGQTVPATLPMSEELLESLLTLDASGSGIEDLTGCEYMTELTSLDLSNNQITDVSPLSKLYSLETLMLDGNPILDTSVLRELERRGTTINITIYRYPNWDVNQDSDVDEADVFLVTATITGEAPDVNGDGSVNADDTDAADVNKDNRVDTDDLLLVFEKFDRPVNLAAPLLSAESVGLDWRLLERIDADRLRVHLEILRATNDGSLKYQQAIAFLQAVLAAIQPNQTLLLANYPNPFNPETWIPYQLARGSDVWITIYDTRGAVIRRLALGYRAEGYYRVRGRAAHWNGRNAVGERVASGIYFYQLETDDASLLRKMVILK